MATEHDPADVASERRATSEPGAAGAAQAVRAGARAFERDRYLAALLAPAPRRDDLVVLAAFAGELARIPALVSEPVLGEIRLQWWRDAVDAGLGPRAGLSGHPVGDAFVEVLRRRGMTADAVHGVIDAQAARLDSRPFADLAALEANLASWDGGLFQLAWRLLGGTGAPPHVLTVAGQAYGLARLLIEAPAELAQGRVLLPRAMLAEHGLDSRADALAPAAFIIGAESSTGATGKGVPRREQSWQALIAELARRVERQLVAAIADYRPAGSEVRLAALPLALVRPYLRVSRRIDMAALLAVDVTPLTRVWRLLQVSLTGRP